MTMSGETISSMSMWPLSKLTRMWIEKQETLSSALERANHH